MALLAARGFVAGLFFALIGACADDKADDKASTGVSGATTGQSGSLGQSGTSGQSGGDAGNSMAGSRAGGGDSGSSGGGGAGSAGKSGTGEELAASLTACKPTCPQTQYCALIEVNCTGKACLVNAVCKDRPTCSMATQFMCPLEPMQSCEDDPTTDCAPADPGCTGICRCTENSNPCAPLGLDRRPSVCGCVDMKGTTKYCSDLECPADAQCVIELGKGYCVVK